MTLHEVATQIHHLTVGGYINDEKFTIAQFENALKGWMRSAETNKIPNAMVFQVSLPDGKWLCEVTQGHYGYDYWIPDNREQERRLYDLLTA